MTESSRGERTCRPTFIGSTLDGVLKCEFLANAARARPGITEVSRMMSKALAVGMLRVMTATDASNARRAFNEKALCVRLVHVGIEDPLVGSFIASTS